MNFDYHYDLIINLAGGPTGALLKSTTSLAAGPKPVWKQNDNFNLRLWFVTPGATLADPPILTPLDDDAVIALGARPKSNLEDDGLLFFVTDFTPIMEGSPPTVTHYEKFLNLNTTALNTALQGKSKLEVVVDLEIRNADDTQRITIPQFDATILRDIYRGTEGVPIEGNPVYPVPSAIELVARKGQPNGYAPLDDNGLVPAEHLILPSALIIKLTLTDNETLTLPEGLTDGQVVRWWITQGGDGGYTLTPSEDFILPNGITELTLSTTPGSCDLLIGEYHADSGKMYLTGLILYTAN